jgi:hypothetical protein
VAHGFVGTLFFLWGQTSQFARQPAFYLFAARGTGGNSLNGKHHPDANDPCWKKPTSANERDRRSSDSAVDYGVERHRFGGRQLGRVALAVTAANGEFVATRDWLLAF